MTLSGNEQMDDNGMKQVSYSAEPTDHLHRISLDLTFGYNSFETKIYIHATTKQIETEKFCVGTITDIVSSNVDEDKLATDTHSSVFTVDLLSLTQAVCP